MSAAVLFIVFNRPELTRRTWERIRAARPAQLFVHADGARSDRPGEAERCAAVRAVIDSVDWPCEVRRRFQAANLGCGRAVAGALDWFFSEVESGLVLEDDCEPEPAFFAYATAMLDRYRHDDRVMHISGTGFAAQAAGAKQGGYSLAPFPLIWGWASWARAWQHYRRELPRVDEIAAVVERHLPRPIDRRYWTAKFLATREGRIDTWDYQWVFALWRRGGLAVTPHFSLITNSGHTEDATHALGAPPNFAPLRMGELDLACLCEEEIPADRFLAAINDRIFHTAVEAPPPRWLAALYRVPGMKRLAWELRSRTQSPA